MGADTERARVGPGHHGREKLPLPNRSAEWASQHGVDEPEHRIPNNSGRMRQEPPKASSSAPTSWVIDKKIRCRRMGIRR